MDISLRLLTKNDAEDFRKLRLHSYQESPFAFSESYEDEQSRPLEDFEGELAIQGDPPEWFVLGAFANENELIGFVKFRRDMRSKGRHKSMIHAMYTHPEYRKRGVGRALVQDLIKRTAQLTGLEQIHLWVLHAGTSASYFYESLGFERQGYVKKDLKVQGQYVDAEYMVMYLSQ